MPTQKANTEGQGDRLLALLAFYEKDKATAVIKNPIIPANDRYHLELEREINNIILDTYKRRSGLTAAEKDTRAYILHANRRLERLIHPTPLSKVLLFPIVQRLKNFLVAGTYGVRDKTLKQTRDNIYGAENFNNLKEELKKAGFNLSVDERLKELLKHNLKSFPIRYSDPKFPKTEFVLHFAKHPGTDAYYFQKFDSIQRDNTQSVITNDPKSSRLTFNMNNGEIFNAKEAFNIQNDRPIMKVVDGISTWFTKDRTQPNGIGEQTFDLYKELSRWPIQELHKIDSATKLLDGLEAGLLREVTLTSEKGNESKVLVGVRSDSQGLNFYSPSGQLIDAAGQMSKKAEIEKMLSKVMQKEMTSEISTKESYRMGR